MGALSPQARLVVIFASLGHFLHHVLTGLFLTLAIVLERVWEKPYAEIIALWTLGAAMIGLGAPLAGWLADRFGRRFLMIAFFMGSGAFMVAAGFAPSPLMLAITLGAMGAFVAIYHPIGTAILVEAAGPKVGRAMGINGVFGNLGVATAPVLTAFIAADAGWRWAFIIPGIACIIAGFFYWREPPFDSERIQAGGKPFPEIPPALVRRAVIILLAIATVSGLVFNAYTLLIPKLMEERLASSPELLPIVGLLSFLATICGGLAPDTDSRQAQPRLRAD